MEHLKKINMKNIKKLFKKETPIVYTMENCNYCTKLKEDFQENNIEFIEKDIRKNEKEWRSIVRTTGYPNTPTVSFKGVYLSPMRDFANPTILIDLLEDLKNDKHNYQVETFEKLKTMNYQISEAFNKLMETMQENNSTKTENNKNKKD